MRYANWLAATAAGASLSLLSADAMAQLKASPRAEAGAQGSSSLAAEREAAETSDRGLIPVVDANARATFRATQLIGTNITDAAGRTIGKVVDFVSDSRGNIQYPIISYSGSPGFSGKLFAVPKSGLTFTGGANNTTIARLSFDPQMLKNAPSFSSTRFPDFSDQVFLSELTDFYTALLAVPAVDPTVPANGPGDRVQTQAQAGTPTRPIDPTLPANGPGDRPATVNPALPRTGTQPAPVATDTRIPGTTGTENAGFPPTSGSTRAATSRSAGTDGSIVDRTGSPAGSTIPGGTVVGRTGLPALSTIPEPGDVKTGVNAEATGGTRAANNRMMLRSSQMVGMSIQDKQGSSIGEVVDLVADSDGNNQFAVVSLTGDNRMIVLPSRALHFQAGARGSTAATLRVAPGQLKNAPSFTGENWPNFTDARFTRQVSNFFSDLVPPPGTVVAPPPGSGLPTPGASKGYDYGRFPINSPDGTNFPRRAAPGTPAPGVKPAPGAPVPAPKAPAAPAKPILPRPRPGGAGPTLPAPRISAPGVPGLPAPGGAPGGPATGGGAPRGAGGGGKAGPREN